MSRLINRKGSATPSVSVARDGTELLQFAQNENKVTLAAVQQLKILCLSETRGILQTLD